MPSASKGLFAGIEAMGKEVNTQKNLRVEEEKEPKSERVKKGLRKRSYMLKATTIKKLQELKVFVYDDPDITYNEIVDEAICNLYNKLKSGK